MAFSSGSHGGDVVSDINITPLVDVMLVLMVVFILTAPVLNNAIHISLPKASTSAAAPTDLKAVTVSVDADGKVFIDQREIALGGLERELKQLVVANKEQAVTLQGHEGVPYRSVAQAMAAIQRAGVTKLSVLTAPAT